MVSYFMLSFSDIYKSLFICHLSLNMFICSIVYKLEFKALLVVLLSQLQKGKFRVNLHS